jgi:hypothetical protein
VGLTCHQLRQTGGVTTARPSDRALWTAVVETLRRDVLPHLDDTVAHRTASRLVALATYARDRDGSRPATVAAAVHRLVGDADAVEVLLDPTDPRRGALRRLLVDDLDHALAEERPLFEAVRDGQFDPGFDAVTPPVTAPPASSPTAPSDSGTEPDR